MHISFFIFDKLIEILAIYTEQKRDELLILFTNDFKKKDLKVQNIYIKKYLIAFLKTFVTST